MLKTFADTEDVIDKISHNDVLLYLSRDNKRFKGLRKFVRDQVSNFYKQAKSFVTYQVIDYSEGKYHYERNKALGVNHNLNSAFFMNRWVTVISNHWSYKGKRYGSYGNSFWYVGAEGFKPWTFLVGRTGKYYLDCKDSNSMGVDKNQVRLATEEEIQSVIDKQFILSEN